MCSLVIFCRPMLAPTTTQPKSLCYFQILRSQTSKTIYGSFKVFFMATQINERNNFVTVLHNLLPILILILVEPLWHNLFTFLVKAHNFLTDGTSSTSFLLMKVIKDSCPCYSVTVIGHSFCEDRNESWLASVNVSYDTNFEMSWRYFLRLHELIICLIQYYLFEWQL